MINGKLRSLQARDKLIASASIKLADITKENLERKLLSLSIIFFNESLIANLIDNYMFYKYIK